MRVLLLAVLLLVSGCSLVFPPAAERILRDVELHQDTVWQGQIVIDGQVKLFKGATLTILPGTVVSFVKKDLDQDGLGDGTLIIEGSLLAVGTPEQPIRIQSAEADPHPGDWLEIRVDFARDVQLRYCEISHSAYTLHAHFTRGVIADSVIRDNIDGCRLGQARFEIHHCLIAGNSGKGINFRNSRIDLHHNIIHDNGAGVFLFESDRAFSIHDNNIFANRYNFRLGDFYPDDVALQGNWWGSREAAEINGGIYDQKLDPTIGAVTLRPAEAWIAGTGPRQQLELGRAWLVESDGFIDAPPLVVGEKLLFASWDGTLNAVDVHGRPLWQTTLGEVVDAPLASDGVHVYLQGWDRRVRALSVADGREVWSFEYPESMDDDHRQGGLVLNGELLLVPAWNGTLYALDRQTGELRWQAACGQPLRAAPLLLDGKIYQVSGAGTLTILSPAGAVLAERQFPAPLLTTPAVIADGLVLIDREGGVHAVTPAGEPLWQTTLEGPCYYAAPLAADGKLFVATAAARLYRLDPGTGRIIWQQPLPGPSYTSPVYLDQRLLVSDNSGVLTVLSAEGGNILARLETSAPIQSPVVPFTDLLTFGGRDQLLHALTLTSAPVLQP